MADIESTLITEVAANNTAPSPDGLPSLSSPNIVYSEGREVLGMSKRWWNRVNPTVTSGGAANAQTLTYGVAPLLYTLGQQYAFIAGFANTGALTLNVNGLGAKAVQSQGVPLVGGEIKANQIVEVVFDGTQFQIISGQGTFLPVSGPGLAGTTTGGLYNDVGRNKLHNAMFRIQQRGTGAWTASGNYTADRWQLALNSDTTSVSIQPFSDATRLSVGDDEGISVLSCNVTGSAAAAAFTQIVQPIEDVRRLAAKTVTVSFWANAGAVLNIGIRLVQLFGTGGSPSTAVATAAQQVTTLASAAWKRFSATFTLPTVQGKTLGSNNDHSTSVQFSLSSGATNSAGLGVGVQSGIFNFWGMQLEVGSVATPLEKIDIALDWNECGRFFQSLSIQMNGYSGAAAGNWAQLFPFPTRLRAVPGYTTNFTTQTNCGSSNVTAAGTPAQCYQVSTVNTAIGQWSVVGTFTASADL